LIRAFVVTDFSQPTASSLALWSLRSSQSSSLTTGHASTMLDSTL